MLLRLDKIIGDCTVCKRTLDGKGCTRQKVGWTSAKTAKVTWWMRKTGIFAREDDRDRCIFARNRPSKQEKIRTMQEARGYHHFDLRLNMDFQVSRKRSSILRANYENIRTKYCQVLTRGGQITQFACGRVFGRIFPSWGAKNRAHKQQASGGHAAGLVRGMAARGATVHVRERSLNATVTIRVRASDIFHWERPCCSPTAFCTVAGVAVWDIMSFAKARRRLYARAASQQCTIAIARQKYFTHLTASN